MGDVNPNASAPVSQDMEAPSGEVKTPVSGSQPANQTPVVSQPAENNPPSVDTTPERAIPYTRFKQVNEKLSEAQRELAKLKGQNQFSQYDPESTEQIINHPLVQKLLINEAKREVTDYAKELLDQYPDFPPVVKKAILSNVRGFIKEETTDPETAKLDVAEYIDSIANDMASQPKTTVPEVKGFPVGPSNAGTVPQNTGSKPVEIQKILEKPVTEWTDEETQKIDSHTKNTLK